MMTSSTLYSQKKEAIALSNLLDQYLSIPTAPAFPAADNLDLKYYQPFKVPIVTPSPAKYDRISAYAALIIESEVVKGSLDLRLKKMNNLLTTLEKEVEPILGVKKKDVTRDVAERALRKIHEVLTSKFGYRYKYMNALSDIFSNKDLEADCDLLSLIYYSVLKEMLGQPVVMVARPMHVHIRWKFKKGHINWEATDGSVLSDEYYSKIWLQSNYAVEFGDYDIGSIKAYKTWRPNDVLSLIYYNRGYTKGRLGDHKGAIKDFTTSIKLNPNYAESYYNRGAIKADSKYYRDAIQDYDQAIKLDPNYVKAYANRAVNKGELKNYLGAIQDYNKVIKLNPESTTSANYYNNRATYKFELKEYAGSLQDYNHAIKINPSNGEMYYNRAIIKEILKDFKGAAEDFRKAKELAPTFFQ